MKIDAQHEIERPKTALIYCRVSTRRQEQEGTGLDSQEAACVAYAERLGYRIGRVTREVFSGAELFERPKLALDRDDIRARRFDALIVYDIERLARDAEHLAIISSECEQAECRLIFVNEELKGAAKLSQPDSASYGETEREKIRERTERGRLTKLRQGQPLFGGWELYGYRSDRVSGSYKIHLPEATIVSRVFNMCALGRGMQSIAATVNGEGIPSPKADKRSGARWTFATICRILNTRSYISEEYCCKTRRGERTKRDRPRPESEWVRLPDGTRPPIIPPVMYGKPASRRHRRPKSRR